MINLGHSNNKTWQERFDYLNSLQYDILLKKTKGKFYLFIPELSLVAIGEDLTQTYNNLNEQKRKLFNEILDCEAENEIVLPRNTCRRHKVSDQLKVFTYKLLIVCFLLGTTLMFGAAAINDKIASISSANIAKKIIRISMFEIEKFNDLPGDAKKMQIEKLHKFLESLRPVVDEFRNTFSPRQAEIKAKEGLQ